jgi:hypothetical protein
MRVALGVVVLLTISCGSGQPPVSAQSAPPGRAARVVNATILTNGCQELGKTNAKLAETAMYQLVEGCASVPGGAAEFLATLQPGGRIEIGAAAGQPDVVPICILKHSLLHRVALTKPCRLDVKIEQTSVALPVDAGGD